MSVVAASRTHIGLVRRRNEDAVYEGQWLYVVADGLGGHVAGHIASTIAVDALKAFDSAVEPADLADVLGRAIGNANESLRRRIREDPELDGMGTTVVAMLRSGDAAVVGNIGDSRAYLLRNGSLVRISEDHTYQNVVADAETVPGLPAKLVRWLDGRKDGRSADLTGVRLREGDRILLCSDGLSSVVPETELQEVLAGVADPDEVADSLVTLALAHGGQDNVTVVVVNTHPSDG